MIIKARYSNPNRSVDFFFTSTDKPVTFWRPRWDTAKKTTSVHGATIDNSTSSKSTTPRTHEWLQSEMASMIRFQWTVWLFYNAVNFCRQYLNNAYIKNCWIHPQRVSYFIILQRLISVICTYFIVTDCKL